MAIQDIVLTENLKTLWLRAAKEQVVEIDFDPDETGILKAKKFKTALYNFRRTVRLRKLHPEYVHLWSEISRCRLYTITPTKFRIQIRYPLNNKLEDHVSIA